MTMTTMTTTTKNPKSPARPRRRKNEVSTAELQEVIDHLAAGTAHYQAAGAALVDLHERDPNIRRRLAKLVPGFSGRLFDLLLAVGRGELHPHLMLDRSYPARTLGNLPYAMQEKVIDAGTVRVLEVTGSGETDFRIVEKPWSQLSIDETKQVFTDSGLRDPADQRAVIDRMEAERQERSRQAAASRAMTTGPKWELAADGSELVIHREAHLTLQQVRSLADEMTSRALAAHDKG